MEGKCKINFVFSCPGGRDIESWRGFRKWCGTLSGFYLENFFLRRGGRGGGAMGGTHSECEDFAKSARRDVIDQFHMKMHF